MTVVIGWGDESRLIRRWICYWRRFRLATDAGLYRWSSNAARALLILGIPGVGFGLSSRLSGSVLTVAGGHL